MSRYLRYTLLTLLWVAVAAYIVFAASAVRRVRRTGTVGRLEIEVVDSSSQGHLVSAAMVRQWISHAGIKTLGTAVDAVDLTGIERLIARNGFVDKTVAYVSYGGTLHIEISQRKPLVRLLTDGMNAYVTADGYVFAAPRASSLYVPVVTGSYRPPFPASYVGSVREHIDLRLGEIDERIAELEREKYPLYRREMENDRNISALRRMRIKRQWWRLEGSAGVRCAGRRAAREKSRPAPHLPLPGGRDPRGDRAYRRVAGGRAAETKKVGEKLRRFHETPYLCRNCRRR